MRISHRYLRRGLVVAGAAVITATGLSAAPASAEDPEETLLGTTEFTMHTVNDLEAVMAQQSTAVGRDWRPIKTEAEQVYVFDASGDATLQTFHVRSAYATRGKPLWENSTVSHWRLVEATPATGPYAATPPTYDANGELIAVGTTEGYLGQQVNANKVDDAGAQLAAAGMRLIAREKDDKWRMYEGLEGVRIQVMRRQDIPNIEVTEHHTSQAPIDLGSIEHWTVGPTDYSGDSIARQRAMRDQLAQALDIDFDLIIDFGFEVWTQTGGERPPSLWVGPPAPVPAVLGGVLNSYAAVDISGVFDQFTAAGLTDIFTFLPGVIPGFDGATVGQDDQGIIHAAVHVNENNNPDDDV